ncbi:YicC family protein [Aureivirga sp. CE67]|uniref:YicC family protein n=1 Tax=Aureivirga sp. CE67 TaxID=1788983 RepID=UPI001E28C440|nr:DUF1732 domain-containing protein [Aureivirga sp. CE67]
MTGYGKSILQLPTKKITIEVKSLNSKNLDINVRIPSYYKEKELEIRKLLASNLTRGKVDFSIYVDNTGEELTSQINEVAVKQYISKLKQISHGSDLEMLQMAMRLPEALKTEREELDETEWSEIVKHINKAVSNIVTYRVDEGKALIKDFNLRIENIQTLLKEVIKVDEERMVHVKQRLRKALEELEVKVDENRFEQELIYYLEKLDINEEKVRLENHLKYFIEELATPESNGKKLGFITQEIGREINTMGSKSNFAPMQKLVVQMKDELEKIKEQNLNVL